MECLTDGRLVRRGQSRAGKNRGDCVSGAPCITKSSAGVEAAGGERWDACEISELEKS